MSSSFRSSVGKSIEAFDEAIDRFFEPARGSKGFDTVAYLASELADYSVGWHLLNASTALVSPRLEPKAVRMALTLGAESIIVNGGLKPIFNRERPADWEDAASLQVRRPRTASFPSGHASSGAVAAILLSDAVPALKPVWWGAAVIVAGSRVYTRMHHASDVVAGAAVGAAIGLAAKRLLPR